MRVMPHTWLSILIAGPLAVICAPLLLQVPWVNYFLVYSFYSPLENLFLLSAISAYGIAQLLLYRLRHGVWRAVARTVFFYWIAAVGVLVIGLVSLALLWVMPMALLLFDDQARAEWQRPRVVNS